MRYILKCKITNKETKEIKDSYCYVGQYGLYPCLLNMDKVIAKNPNVVIYDNLERAKQEVSKMSKAFRRDDVWQKAQEWQKSKLIRHFYLEKVDSYNFPFILKQNKDEKNKEIFYIAGLKTN